VNVGRALRVVVAEDSAVLRDSLGYLLTARGHQLVAAVGDAEALLRVVAEQAEAGSPVDIVIVDVRMPPTRDDEGLRAALVLRARHPDVGVLVFSQYVETRHCRELFASDRGGVGYLLKDRVGDVGEFLRAISRVANGELVVDPQVVALTLAAHSADPLPGLSPREREVLALMAEGRTNVGIATALNLAAGSVEKYVTTLFAKLGLTASPQDHRRVLAVLHFLRSTSAP
jgi:DNA-binding NarL/FixJ family response regulator